MMLLGKALRGMARNKLSVFLFHKVPARKDPLIPNDLDLAGFARLMDFIEENFLVLPLCDAVMRLAKGDLKRGCACITFDDGYPDWVSGVVPLLEARAFPATFFITTGQFLGRPMWHERLANVLQKANQQILETSSYRLPPLPIGTPEERQQALVALEYHFKYLPIVLRDIYLSQLEAQYGVDPGAVPVMTEDQLRTISNRGFDIGSHTIDHPILSLCNAQKARDEIGGTREVLEGIIRSPVTAFAYPNGRPYIDFNHQHIDMVKQAGYTHAVTTQWGVATGDSSIYQTPRFTPWGPDVTHMSVQVIRNLMAKPEYINERRD